MNIELEKTLGFEMAHDTGIAALHRTLTTGGRPLGGAIAEDLTMMCSQAVNTAINSPGKPGAMMPMAQLVGYLGELSRVAGMMPALGFRFTTKKTPLGMTELVVSFKPRKTK